LLEPRRLLSTLTVSNTDDAGPGSLRQAILDSNVTPGRDTIRFNTLGGVHTIRPGSPLPELTDAVTIDARVVVREGLPLAPGVEIDGSAAGPDADGLVVRAFGTTITGLAINRFSRHGIVVRHADGIPPEANPSSTSITVNRIGTTLAGDAAAGNGGAGILVESPGVTIGGSRAGRQGVSNVISANGLAGVWVAGPDPATGTVRAGIVGIFGNNIGTDVTGTRALGNGREGVFVNSAIPVHIGGPKVAEPPADYGNTISGNRASGIRLTGSPNPSAANQIMGNYVGTDISGAAALGNGNSPDAPSRDGITIAGSTLVTITGNVVSANAGAGIRMSGPSGQPAAAPASTIAFNGIGTGAVGTARLGNGGSGIRIAGGAGGVAIRENRVGNNGGDGITLGDDAAPSTGNVIDANAIGVTELRAPYQNVGNGRHGVAVVNGSGNRITNNTIVSNGSDGVAVVSGNGNLISRNTIQSNGSLGIDLAPLGLHNGVDPLDADTGPNGLQNAPILEPAAFWQGFGAEAPFHLHSAPRRAYRIEFFSGGVFATSTDVTTDAEGNASGVGRLSVSERAAVTATATEISANNTSELSISATPFVTPVVGGHFFYNNSAYDGHDPAANPSDDGAIAPDKHPLLTRTQPQTIPLPANYTTYAKGINGIMLDVAGAAAGPPLSAADFNFVIEEAVRQDTRLTSRTRPAPAPSAITVRPGAGANGSDRVTITWTDGAIRNAWLRVTYLRTDPANRTTWSFGNLAGNSAEWGFPPGPAARQYVRVNALDLAAMRAHLTSATADLANRYDHNRDGRVDLLDFAVVRNNLGAVLQMYWFPGR
jgi:parallel beta-helix repeat protein